jgi:hypothetical protein
VPVGTRGEYVCEETLRGSLVAKLLQQDVEFGTVLIDGAPQHVRLAAQRQEHFVQVPRTAWLAASRLDLREARAKLVAPAADRLVADDHAALEQQLFDVAQAELEPEVLPVERGRRK